MEKMDLTKEDGVSTYPVYLKNGLVIFTCLGALIGIGVMLWFFFSNFSELVGQRYLLLPVLFLFVTLYALGFVAAIIFARDTKRRTLLRIYYALQVIHIEIPFLGFGFFSGSCIVGMIGFRENELLFNAKFSLLGSEGNFNLSSAGDLNNAAWVVGINLVAIVVLWLLRVRISK